MTGLKLPRTIRLDPSDAFVFDHAAEAGEWAVTGSFLFLDAEPGDLSPKQRTALRSGFVGVRSFGFSTLVVVTEASEVEREEAIAQLALHIRTRLGAPTESVALDAAREELAVSASLCAPEVGTILAMRRSLLDGELREEFRTLRPRENGIAGADRLHSHARAFEFVETDEEEPAERVDLAGLMGSRT